MRMWLESNENLGSDALISSEHPGRKTIYASWEDGHDDIERRIRSMLKGDTEDGVVTADLADQGALFGPVDGRFNTAPEFTETWNQLKANCRHHDAKLLIVDALASAFAGNENDRGQVRSFMAQLDAWGRETDTTIILISHPSKGGADYSRSTDWCAASRVAWTLRNEPLPGQEGKKDAKTDLALSIAKSNYGRTTRNGAPIRFYLQRNDERAVYSVNDTLQSQHETSEIEPIYQQNADEPDEFKGAL